MLGRRVLESLRSRILLAALTTAFGCGHSTAVIPSMGPEGADASMSVAAIAPNEESTGKAQAACCEEAAGQSQQPQSHRQVEAQKFSGGVEIPDVSLVNQDGQPVRFRSDLIKGKIVAVNFIFTTCKGICPPMSANFAKLQERLGDRFGNGVALVSVSVDPQIDTPQRLHAWRETFGGGPGWTLLTGKKQDVDHLLKEMQVFTADKNNHSPFILLGDEAAGTWTRVHGLTTPEQLAQIIAGMYEASHAAVKPTNEPQSEEAADRASNKAHVLPAEPSPAQKYFTNVELVNQHGATMKLYSDLLEGKVVVINSFFSTCKGSCPVMLSSFARIQEHFADRIGNDLLLISITVDPQTDTPPILAALAEQWKARPGWYFLTGEKANVDAALYKLGQSAENKESHSNVFIIGNEATGLWKKARGLSKPEEIFPLVEEVLKDKS